MHAGQHQPDALPTGDTRSEGRRNGYLAQWWGAAADWAASHALKRVLSLEAPVGPWRDELERARAHLALQGIELQILRRSWDECFWPYAAAGYFRFKQKAWPYLRELAA